MREAGLTSAYGGQRQADDWLSSLGIWSSDYAIARKFLQEGWRLRVEHEDDEVLEAGRWLMRGCGQVAEVWKWDGRGEGRGEMSGT